MALKNGRQSSDLQTILVGSVIPTGTIAPFAGGVVPAGWLLCDGSTVPRSTYSALFDKINTIHGAGDGSTTFHLPDYRGRFLRGADNMGTGAADRDPGDNRTAANTGGNSTGLGSVQDSENKTHDHFTVIDNATNSRTDLSASNTMAKRGLKDAASYDWYFLMGLSGTPNRSLSSDTGGVESRPQNAACLYIIKV
jgi:microcystin-dependent protein